MHPISRLFLFLILTLATFTSATFSSNPNPNRTFSIDYENNCFEKDGQPFQYVSGSMHYFRVLEDKWDDILYKMKLAGLNTVQLYVEWSSHQSNWGEYNFNGNLNISKLMELAMKHDLLVILRPGPYIDAERDMGGLPPWLLWKYEHIQLRSTDPDFTYEVSKWFGVLLNKLKPYLYVNGGPIIMIQVENEYGSYGCDMEYKLYLRDLIKSIVGPQVVLFTTDFADEAQLRCGNIPEVYPTIDFGTESKFFVDLHFAIQRLLAPKGPLVNSEFYSGWFDRWGQPHSVVNATDVAATLDTMLGLGANVNIYMFHGGTSFGLRSGSTTDNITGPGSFQSTTTSYDYDAPLNEAGDPTEKYFELKKIIGKYKNVSSEDPVVSPKGNYGKILLQPLVSILDEAILKMFAGNPLHSRLPLRFEDLYVPYGFMLYETTIPYSVPDPSLLTVEELRDRAYVYVGKELAGILSRSENISSLPIFIEKGETLQILVESQGRPSFGDLLDESKGLGPTIRLGSHELIYWKIYQVGELNAKTFQRLYQKKKNGSGKYNDFATSRSSGMTFMATFSVGNKTNPIPLDTFIRLDGWRKGIVWINNFNLGRYWPAVGPQQTLYLPSNLLNPYPGKNYLIVLELEKTPEGCAQTFETDCFITLTDTHVVNGMTPD